MTAEQRAAKATEKNRPPPPPLGIPPGPPPPVLTQPDPTIRIKAFIWPHFGEADKGDGGIRRVVEAQRKHLPAFGIEIVESPEEADVIAFHATLPPAFLKLYPEKTFVAMCHGFYWSEYTWDKWSLAANAEVMEGIRVADATIACSDWVANAIRRHASRNVDVIYHGVDIEDWPFEPVSELNYVLWNKTRPDPVCDPEPINVVASIMPDVQFVTTFGNESPNVKVTGKLDFDIAKELVKKAGVYLATSRETFGIGTLEAMACGVPIVGFRFGGQEEFIEQGIDGWLATPGDIDGLAEGIRWAMANRETVGAAARKKAEALNWEKAAEAYAGVFRRAYHARNLPAPRTSIIVTNYNLGAYLTQCLESVRNQTDQSWECIIVDDNSSDPDGRMIAEQFAQRDSRFKLVCNDENVYLSEARNVGIRLAHGRYILPLDADDMLDPNAVAILGDALDSDRGISVAYGNVKFTEEDGVTLSNYGQQFNLGHSSWPYQFSHEQQIMQRNLLPYCSMYRRDAWLQTGGYRRRCRTAEDADMWTRFSSYGFRPKMVTDQDTLIYRNRENSMSRIQGEVDWIKWFSWSKVVALTPAGAGTKEQLPVPSLDPIVVSVIIPMGPGHEKIVTDAIDSVDCQSYKNWECILVNDSGKPLQTELPAWVKVINTIGRTGVAHARNVGIEASRGKFFLPLDADDYLEPDALAFMVQASENQYVVYSDFWQTDGADKTHVTMHETDDYDPKLIIGGRRSVKGTMREGMMHPVTALTPKIYWKQIGGYDETLPAWEDWDFQIALGNIGVCSRRIAMPLFFYRKHTGYRREENFEFFERSKEGILRKWGDLWEGGKQLMACGSCQRGKTVQPMGNAFGVKAIRPENSDSVLIRYVGPMTGSTPFRGPSKTVYWFASGDERWVLSQDLVFFESRGEDFKAVPPAPEPMVIGEGPILDAVGQA